MERSKPVTLDPSLAKKIRVVAFDVDGVMTDAGVFIGMVGSERVEVKKFSTQDSVGIKFLMAAGLEVVLVSGRVSEATTVRANELGIREVIQVADARKIPPFEALLERLGVEFSEAAFVGDDLPDVPVLRRVGLPVGVGNAVPEVKAIAAFTTTRCGGDGAVREFAEALLKARGEWDHVVNQYLVGRGDSPPIGGDHQ